MTHGLRKLYGRRVGVEDLDLSLAEGTIFGFLGPNGSGKTTTIRLLLGFLRPTAGTARIFDLDCWRDSARLKEEVGYLPGDLRLYAWMTGRTALRIFGGVRRRDLLPEGSALAEYFDLDLDLRVSQMSRGTRQKLGLILALAHRPRLIILDEPTASLDPVIQERLKQRLEAMARQGHTVFFSSHTLSEVERLCDRLAILRNGRIVADTSLEGLRADARREVRITWRAPADSRATATPDCLEVVERQERTWRCELTGEPERLVHWLQGRGIEDLTIGPPDLDSVFRRYYGE